MGPIRKMVALLKAVGFEVHDVSEFDRILRGRGATPDEGFRRISENEYDKPDPPGVIKTNRQRPQEPVEPIGKNFPLSKRKRGRPRKVKTQRAGAKRPSMFDVFKKLRRGEKN